MNKKGQAFLGGILSVQIIAGLIAAMTGTAVVKTAINGTLQNNGKVIWCKMLNKGEDHCNEKYNY